LADASYPTASLLRAFALSRGLGAGLHVVRVLPMTAMDVLVRKRGLPDTAHSPERALSAHQATRAWLDTLLGEHVALEQVAILQGDFAAQVATYVPDVRACLVVVASRETPGGQTMTSLAHCCKVPILVAREVKMQDAIVAATDLQSPEYPVLRMAAELGACFDAPVVTVHNVNPISVLLGTGVGWPPVSVLPADPTRAARAVQLKRATERLSVEARAVLRDEVSAADAILDEAKLNDADLVVVGTRQRSWLQRLLSGNVAEQIVKRANCSVLITPIDGSASATS